MGSRPGEQSGSYEGEGLGMLQDVSAQGELISRLTPAIPLGDSPLRNMSKTGLGLYHIPCCYCATYIKQKRHLISGVCVMPISVCVLLSKEQNITHGSQGLSTLMSFGDI